VYGNGVGSSARSDKHTQSPESAKSGHKWRARQDSYESGGVDSPCFLSARLIEAAEQSRTNGGPAQAAEALAPNRSARADCPALRRAGGIGKDRVRSFMVNSCVRSMEKDTIDGLSHCVHLASGRTRKVRVREHHE
jgi:hypothetical protein